MVTAADPAGQVAEALDTALLPGANRSRPGAAVMTFRMWRTAFLPDIPVRTRTPRSRTGRRSYLDAGGHDGDVGRAAPETRRPLPPGRDGPLPGGPGPDLGPDGLERGRTGDDSPAVGEGLHEQQAAAGLGVVGGVPTRS